MLASTRTHAKSWLVRNRISLATCLLSLSSQPSSPMAEENDKCECEECRRSARLNIGGFVRRVLFSSPSDALLANLYLRTTVSRETMKSILDLVRNPLGSLNVGNNSQSCARHVLKFRYDQRRHTVSILQMFSSFLVVPS